MGRKVMSQVRSVERHLQREKVMMGWWEVGGG